MGAYGDYLVIFGIAVVATYLLTFPVRRVATRLGAVAQPGDSHIHAEATPTIGGAAMLLAFVVAMLVASQLPGLRAVFAGSSEPLGVVLAAVVIYLVGLVDDVRNISAPAKVAGQVLAAMVLVLLGVTMYYFKIPFVAGIYTLSPSLLPLVTALWVVGMANAVNLIDGLDGLAAGIVAIASGTLCVYSLRLVDVGVLPAGANNLGPVVAAIACGVCIGFLPHNFHPARVFMGDGGALLLGLLMAASTMVIGGRTGGTAGSDVSGETFFRFAPLFIPFFILGVPILDTLFAIVRRTVRRTGVSERDLGHLHHHLVRLGHGHRRAVLILWAWTAVLSGFVLYPAFDQRANSYVPFGVAFLGVSLYTLFRPGARSRPAEAVSSGDHAGTPEDRAAPAAIRSPTVRRVPPAAPVGLKRPVGGASVSVVVSGAAGKAVAGEPDLTSPARRRRRQERTKVPRLRRSERRLAPPGTDLPG